MKSATQQALELVRRTPDGIMAKTVADAVGVSTATACAILARLFWAGRVDRRKPVGAKYRYTPRERV